MLNDHIVILDGGMGRELERIGAPFSQPFWSAQALIEAPETVAQVHRNFIQAGAKVITTNSYAVVPPHIGQDLFDQRGRELIRLAAKLVRQEAEGNNVQVAACIPPVFGSYQPENFSAAMATQLISPFFEEQEAYADIFLAETISSIEEALTIITIYKNLGASKPLWLALTLQEFFDETLQPQIRSGENLTDSVRAILQEGTGNAILFNCCTVEDITAAFNACERLIKDHPDIKFGAYANVFGKVKGTRSPTNDLSSLREDMSPETYLNYARQWREKGAKIIGGCCGIGPEYIALLSKNLI